MDVEFKEQERQPVLSIRTRTNMENLPKTIGDSYHKIAVYMEELGEKPKSEPFVAYYNMDMQDMDIEIGFPVGKLLSGKGDIRASEIEAGPVATYMYKGPYSGMEPVYIEIFKQIEEKKCIPKGVFYEFYYNAPDEVSESELLTRIVIPIV